MNNHQKRAEIDREIAKLEGCLAGIFAPKLGVRYNGEETIPVALYGIIGDNALENLPEGVPRFDRVQWSRSGIVQYFFVLAPGDENVQKFLETKQFVIFLEAHLPDSQYNSTYQVQHDSTYVHDSHGNHILLLQPKQSRVVSAARRSQRPSIKVPAHTC